MCPSCLCAVSLPELQLPHFSCCLCIFNSKLLTSSSLSTCNSFSAFSTAIRSGQATDQVLHTALNAGAQAIAMGIQRARGEVWYKEAYLGLPHDAVRDTEHQSRNILQPVARKDQKFLSTWLSRSSLAMRDSQYRSAPENAALEAMEKHLFGTPGLHL